MGSYSVRLQPSVERDARHIRPSDLRRIFERMEALADDPFPRGAVKLSGAEGLYRVRVGDYRIVYNVEQTANEIVIHYVRHRRDVYRRM
jgi:mRNA interferase RelE/StbE